MNSWISYPLNPKSTTLSLFSIFPFRFELVLLTRVVQLLRNASKMQVNPNKKQELFEIFDSFLVSIHLLEPRIKDHFCRIMAKSWSPRHCQLPAFFWEKMALCGLNYMSSWSFSRVSAENCWATMGPLSRRDDPESNEKIGKPQKQKDVK